jgi:hypothetical protein
VRDAERLEDRLVEGDRLIEILDGYEDVVEQEFTSFVSLFLLNRKATGWANQGEHERPRMVAQFRRVRIKPQGGGVGKCFYLSSGFTALREGCISSASSPSPTAAPSQ